MSSSSTQGGSPVITGDDSGSHAHQLIIRQNPKHARMCGFGEKDRRPIDSPPIVQLVVRDKPNGELLPGFMDNPYYVMHTTVWERENFSWVLHLWRFSLLLFTFYFLPLSALVCGPQGRAERHRHATHDYAGANGLAGFVALRAE